MKKFKACKKHYEFWNSDNIKTSNIEECYFYDMGDCKL